jgi:hypothetical protein
LHGLRVQFYLKGGFCQPDENLHMLNVISLPLSNIMDIKSYIKYGTK